MGEDTTTGEEQQGGGRLGGINNDTQPETVNPPQSENTVKEVRGVPFQKGHDPRRNTAGRPDGARNFTTKVKQALSNIADGSSKTYEQLLIKRILKKAIDQGDGRMIQLLWEQIDGKAPQAIDITSKGEQVTSLSAEDRAKIDKLLGI